MADQLYRCLSVYEESGNFFHRIEEKPLSALHKKERVLVRVKYSSINYKDALSFSGHKGITKVYPHTPGIDAAGLVEDPGESAYKVGDEVIVTSYDLGMNTPGGFSEYISVPPQWIVSLPHEIGLRQSMLYGTAGFTAALALHKMEQAGQNPEMGKILVTGATGAVGSMAISLLKACGYQIIASSGKKDKHEYLRQLGAHEIIKREAVNDSSNRAFLKTQWAGAIDTVGGNTLSTILKAAGHNANIAVCGLVASPEFSTTVYPFIIKGNNLLGVESAECDMNLRQALWEKLATKWSFNFPEDAIHEVDLELVPEYIERMLSSNLHGRVLIKL